ncbi:MAG: hypothetical protein AAGG51_08420 [Cyanobacteria bacterium P01_G01_bin.54]
MAELRLNRLFEVAAVARFSPSEQAAYHHSLKHYWDLANVVSAAKRRGYEAGLRQAVLERAALLLDVLDDATISQKTGLAIAEIERLRAGEG